MSARPNQREGNCIKCRKPVMPGEGIELHSAVLGIVVAHHIGVCSTGARKKQSK